MIIDSHCHLDFPDFESDFNGLLSRSHEAGVGAMVTISTRVSQFERIYSIAQAHNNIFCSVGTHPHNADEEPDVTVAELVELSSRNKVVAIGEAGLDYHYDKSSRPNQQQGFRRHIEAARITGLPLVIHARSADEDVANILVEEHSKGAFPFVLHCFSSGAELAKTGLSLGGYISLSGILTFKNSHELQDIAKEVPLDKVLVETDAPYLAPVPHRGKRNEPSFVTHTARKLADLKGVEYEEICRQTTENFYRLFVKANVESPTLAEAL